MFNKSIDISDSFDCIIVGGGPAGLLAGVYLSPSRRRTILVTSGQSRAQWIPKRATYRDSGMESAVAICSSGSKQLSRYEVAIADDQVASINQDDEGFVVSAARGTWSGRTVVLATGVEDLVPQDLGELWNLVPTGRIRLCPTCDAYETTGKRIGLIAYGESALGETEFVRAYSAQLTLLTHGNWLDDGVRAQLMRAGTEIHEAPVKRFSDDGQLAVRLDDRVTVGLDALYVGWGCTCALSSLSHLVRA